MPRCSSCSCGVASGPSCLTRDPAPHRRTLERRRSAAVRAHLHGTRSRRAWIGLSRVLPAAEVLPVAVAWAADVAVNAAPASAAAAKRLLWDDIVGPIERVGRLENRMFTWAWAPARRQGGRDGIPRAARPRVAQLDRRRPRDRAALSRPSGRAVPHAASPRAPLLGRERRHTRSTGRSKCTTRTCEGGWVHHECGRGGPRTPSKSSSTRSRRAVARGTGTPPRR